MHNGGDQTGNVVSEQSHQRPHVLKQAIQHITTVIVTNVHPVATQQPVEHDLLHAILCAYAEQSPNPSIGEVDHNLEQHDAQHHHNDFREVKRVVFVRRDIDRRFRNPHKSQARSHRQQSRDGVKHRLHTKFPTVIPQPKK